MASLDKNDLASDECDETGNVFAKRLHNQKFYTKVPDHEPELDTMDSGLRVVKYDHQPHKAYVELDILSGTGEEREWRETARWIKYEEDVEEGANRWGKPHVASLSFHSLINLRRLIETGVVLLDLEEKDLQGVAYSVVDQMVLNELVQPENKEFVLRSLLLKHKHVNESDNTWRFNLWKNDESLHNQVDDKPRGKNLNVVSNTEMSSIQRRRSATVEAPGGSSNSSFRGVEPRPVNVGRTGSVSGAFLLPDRVLKNLQQRQHTSIDLSKLSLAHLSQDDMKWMSNKEDILRRIPAGSEASVVLVGVDENLEGPTMACVRLAESVFMPNITEVPIPVRFVFILLGPTTFDLDYKEVGRSIATLMSNKEFHNIAYKADDRTDLLKGIHEYLDGSVVLPPGEYEKELFPFDDLKEKNKAYKLRKQRLSVTATASGESGYGSAGVGADGAGGNDGDDSDEIRKVEDATATKPKSLRRTKRWFGGLVEDVKRRYPLYLTDLQDGLNFQCVAAITFIAFAQITGSIAFGGLMGSKTANYIGISETLMASGVGGLIFSIFSGQPLLVIATTGPLLLFDESLFSFCQIQGIDFLVLRTWIGLWLSMIAVVFVAFEGSVLVRFFTRFTLEIFAALISLLFIAESLLNLKAIYDKHPIIRTYGVCIGDPDNPYVPHYVSHEDPASPNMYPQPNTALLSTILMFGTFGVAWFFRAFRNSTFFTLNIRRILGNFAVPISIGALVLVDFLMSETETKKLDVPDGIQPTVDRSWIINPGAIEPGWLSLAAILPSFLLFILIFMEVSIGELITSKSDNKLTKGTGFHLDVLLMCLINTLTGFFGLAWCTVALVRAVAHTSALTVWSTNNPPGDKPKVIGVKEQRVTAFVVSILTCLSILCAPALKMVPMAVLFGVFLFMGVSSMSGIQFFERITLLCKQVANHPQVPYVRRVKTAKMHLFTGIQIFWLAVLWGVKYTKAALSFPFILVILIPFRFYVLRLMFNPDELSVLDSTGEEKKEPIQIVGTTPPDNQVAYSETYSRPMFEGDVHIDTLPKPGVERNGTGILKHTNQPSPAS